MIRLPINYLEVETVYSNTIGRGMRSVALTSTMPGEGVSTMAYALCKRSEAAHQKTLLVEMNMQHPELGELTGHDHEKWLPSIESADASIIHQQGEQTDVLPAPVDTDALVFRNNSSMKDLLDHWLEDYQVVIFDTSPVNSINCHNIPAEMVCSISDGTVMMALAGKTRQSDFAIALERLNQANINLVGVVYNDMHHPRLVDEIIRESRRFDRWFPNAMNRLRRYMRLSAFFNINL